MAKGQLNNIMMAGPISRAELKAPYSWGTPFSFLVARQQGASIKVSGATSNQRLLAQIQSARSVILTGAYFDSWEPKGEKNGGSKIGVRDSGMFLTEDMINSYCAAHVEGKILNLNQAWAVIASEYSSYIKKEDRTEIRQRIINVLCPQGLPADSIGKKLCAVGQPQPKFGDAWYLHLEAEHTWLLNG
jgi:hypothetical protein